jgi:two-component system chemotaxis response regulator CheB
MMENGIDKPVRVLVVDDSALMRKLLTGLLEEDPAIEVLGSASNATEARELIRALSPDVLTLDIEMPGMDGLSFLRKIIELRPMPVIMVSTLTHSGAETTLEALEIGAVDFVEKPHAHNDEVFVVLGEELRAKVKAAAGMRVGLRRAQRRAQQRRTKLPRSTSLVAIGASTGGVESLRSVLLDMDAECPPVVVTQHMPPRFTTAFANRLNRICPMTVREAVHGEMIAPGTVLIAPGSHHLTVTMRGEAYYCALNDEPHVSGHRPSVDVLFRSVASIAGPEALGVILTGMGKDGAAGLLAMRHAGAMTIGQNEASALIYGMPREAFERGAVERQLPLDEIGGTIMSAWLSAHAVGGEAGMRKVGS